MSRRAYRRALPGGLRGVWLLADGHVMLTSVLPRPALNASWWHLGCVLGVEDVRQFCSLA
jgi:hypothetical protein